MYDLTKGDTFKRVPEWIKYVKNNQHKSIVMVLVGNKSDLNDKRSNPKMYKNPKIY